MDFTSVTRTIFPRAYYIEALAPSGLNRGPIAAPQLNENDRFPRSLRLLAAKEAYQETFTNDRLSLSSVFGKPLSNPLSDAANGR